MMPMELLELTSVKILAHLADAMNTLAPTRVNEDLIPLGHEAESGLRTAFPRLDSHRLDVLRAGVWLLADDLHRSHELCQNVPGSYGSAWHAVMHRREGDYSNSLYWWARARGVVWAEVGETPLVEAVRDVAEGSHAPAALAFRRMAGIYDPAVLVKAAQQFAGGGDAASVNLLVALQRLEWISLFTQCVRLAKA